MVYRFPVVLYRSAGIINTGISLKRYATVGFVAESEPVWAEPIRRLRQQRGWSQGELADKAGIRPNTLSEAINGRSPRMDTMQAVADALGVPLWSLFVDGRQYDLLTKQQEADQAVSRLAEEKARLKAELLAEMAGTLDRLMERPAAPALVEPPASVKLKRRAAR